MAILGSISPSAWKWLGLVTAVWVQAVSGNNYTFSNYSDALKTLMKLNQVQLNNLSVAKDIGKAFGLFAGFSSDHVPTWGILLIGSIEGFIGYGVQWLVVSETISPLPYWAMCVFLCLGGNSTTWMNTAVLVTCIRNFRQNRGPVSGLLKGYVGLSTAIFTVIVSALFKDSPAWFLLTLTVLPGVVCITAMLFMKEVPAAAAVAEPDKETQYFSAINVLAVVIAIYMLVYDVTGTHSTTFDRVFIGGLLLLLLAPLVIPAYELITGQKAEDIEALAPLMENAGGGGGGGAMVATEETVVEEGKGKKGIGEELTIWEAIRTFEFWNLFVSFLCGVGTGLSVINNMGQIGEALGYSDVSIFVSLLSIGGFFGRIISGTASEYYIRKSAVPRPLWNAGSQIIMSAGFIILAIAFSGSLYIGSIVVGVCYGVRIAISVPTASELFGLKYYGILYNVLILNLPLGSFLFSGLLAGYLYDAQATTDSDGNNTCTGAHCYRLVFIIMAAACFIGFVLDLMLAYRMRDVYKKIQVVKKARKEAEDAAKVSKRAQ